MINSWTTKEEALIEFKRLWFIKASLSNELVAFCLGCSIGKATDELENELHYVEIQIKEIAEKFNISVKDITI